MAEFPAKLLLFGEYSILLGSSAVGIPFDHFSASLKFIGQEASDTLSLAKESNRKLRGLCDHFMAHPRIFRKFLDTERFATDIGNGLFLESDIPPRYGMGSSGALCAAIYYRYLLNHPGSFHHTDMKNLVSVREAFVEMESFFHGKSSGFDPLISLLKRPLLLDRQGKVVSVDPIGRLMIENHIGVLLLDTGEPCGTGPLVAGFLAGFAPGGNVTSAGTRFCSLVNSIIGKLLSGEINGFFNELDQLSQFQLTHLSHLIVPAFRPIWAEGLENRLFTLKLCGSGGGGFLLCFTRELQMTLDYFKNISTNSLIVSFKPDL